MVHRAWAVRRNGHAAGCATRGIGLNAYPVGDVVDGDIAAQGKKGGGAGLKCIGFRACSRGCEYRVCANVRPDIDKHVVLSKIVNQEAHILEVVQSAVHVLGCAVHPARHQQARAIREWNRHGRFGEQSSGNLPANDAAYRGKASIRVKGMTTYVAEGVPHASTIPKCTGVRQIGDCVARDLPRERDCSHRMWNQFSGNQPNALGWDECRWSG